MDIDKIDVIKKYNKIKMDKKRRGWDKTPINEKRTDHEEISFGSVLLIY